jgi:hypothetical protein
MPMTDQEYQDWMALHVRCTGGGVEQLSEFLAANRWAIIDGWRATYGELCECTDRIVARGAIPDWPRDHANCLKIELDALRAERRIGSRRYGGGNYDNARPIRADGLDHRPGCPCPDCHGGEVLPAWEQEVARRDAKLRELKDYILRNGGVLEDGTGGPKSKRKKKPA